MESQQYKSSRDEDAGIPPKLRSKRRLAVEAASQGGHKQSRMDPTDRRLMESRDDGGEGDSGIEEKSFAAMSPALFNSSQPKYANYLPHSSASSTSALGMSSSQGFSGGVPVTSAQSLNTAAASVISLKDWKSHRVLARPPGRMAYFPGSIKLVRRNRDVGVQFDFAPDQPPTFYSDVLESRSVDVIRYRRFYPFLD